MKRIVRGNDFKLRVPVMKIVDGAKVAFPLPGCTDIKVNVVNQYRRIALSYTIDVSEDNVLLARVEGDKVAVGTYALEVKGKLFGNDWRSNEYEQFQIVDNNASGDTVFEPQEGEDSVEMDTALVVLAPSVELGNLIKDAEETIADTKEALKGVETKMGDIEKRADTAIGAATTAADNANTKAHAAEQSATRANTASDKLNAALDKVTEATNNANGSAESAKSAAARAQTAAEHGETMNKLMDDNLAELEKTTTAFNEFNAAATAAEKKRTMTEMARSEAEHGRATAETQRAEAENARSTAETTRKDNETLRADAEVRRVAAEKLRVKAEQGRAEKTSQALDAVKTATNAALGAAESAQTAASKAEQSATAANNVNATLAEDGTLTITDREGHEASINIGEGEKVKELVTSMERVKESLGHYTARPDIVLTPSEQNVAISADGVKVAKIDWAIAEFTAEKGNEYLFKPNTVDGTVCIFAEKISSVETRSIDYTYSYNEDGTTASATATYLGKTHTYSYAYAEGEDGTKSVTITDESGTVVTELPYQYKTTVGSYAPLVRLNAGAELPEDGYCRFMSHFQGNASMTVAVSYKVGTADLTMKVLRDGVFASISTQLGNLSQKENETRSLAVELKEKMATFVDTNPYVGMVRMNGDASPDAEMTFGDKALMHEVGAEWKLATVKNGVVTHVCAPCRLTLDENGEEVKIDGTDGDVMLINRNANVINATKVVDGREMNCLAIGKTAAKWYGVESKKMPAFGMTPCETVNAKIEGDARLQAHCIYNTTVRGMYGAADTSVLKATYINQGAGHSVSTNGVQSIQNAQNKNADPLTARPYMGWHHGTYEALLTMMFAEIGSVDHTGADMFGSGLCRTSFNEGLYNDDAISAVSGWKIIAATGEIYYSAYTGTQVYVTSKSKTAQLASGLSSAIFNPVQLLEGQRLLDAIAKAGLVDKIGNKANIFYYDESGNAVCASDGSVNLDTGEGMEVLKFYFVVRNVPRCEGMKDGVMTAVVNRYVKMEVADGCQSTDSKKVSFDGAIAILKASIPVYRGFTLPYVGQSREMSYAYYTAYNNKGVMYSDFRCTDRMEDVRPLTIFNEQVYQCDYGTLPPILDGLNKKKNYSIVNIKESFVKAFDYRISLFCLDIFGASLHTHECAYGWRGNNAQNNTTMVWGSLVGCEANYERCSVRTIYAWERAGRTNGRFAGAFAVLLNQ